MIRIITVFKMLWTHKVQSSEYATNFDHCKECVSTSITVQTTLNHISICFYHNINIKDSLLAEALFLVFADTRKETSAMSQKWLWFQLCLQSWTALLKTHAPCFVRWLQLEPAASRAFIYKNSAVIYWAHIVNMTCSDRREQSSRRKSSMVKSY